MSPAGTRASRHDAVKNSHQDHRQGNSSEHTHDPEERAEGDGEQKGEGHTTQAVEKDKQKINGRHMLGARAGESFQQEQQIVPDNGGICIPVDLLRK